MQRILSPLRLPLASASISTGRETRTLTGRGLNALPLPLGYPSMVPTEGLEPSLCSFSNY